MKISVTNIAFHPTIATAPGAGARGVNTLGGPVFIELGQTIEVEMADAEIAVSKATGWFHFGDNPPAPPAYFNQTIAQRRAGGKIG